MHPPFIFLTNAPSRRSRGGDGRTPRCLSPTFSSRSFGSNVFHYGKEAQEGRKEGREEGRESSEEDEESRQEGEEGRPEGRQKIVLRVEGESRCSGLGLPAPLFSRTDRWQMNRDRFAEKVELGTTTSIPAKWRGFAWSAEPAQS